MCVINPFRKKNYLKIKNKVCRKSQNQKMKMKKKKKKK